MTTASDFQLVRLHQTEQNLPGCHKLAAPLFDVSEGPLVHEINSLVCLAVLIETLFLTFCPRSVRFHVTDVIHKLFPEHDAAKVVGMIGTLFPALTAIQEIEPTQELFVELNQIQILELIRTVFSELRTIPVLV
jgi:hypothetical protein